MIFLALSKAMLRLCVVFPLLVAVMAASDESLEARLTAIEEENRQLREGLTGVEKELTGVEKENRQLREGLTLLKGARAGEIAFSVGRGSPDVNVAAGSKVPYNSVITNAGNGWDSQSLEFSAPEAGVYAFFIQSMTSNGANGSCRLGIMKGTTQMVTAYAYRGSSHTNHGSNMAVIELAAGDKVSVVPIAASCPLYGGPYLYATFSGFKLA